MLKILIADDNLMLAQTLEIAVRQWGLEPIIAHDGEEALKVLDSQTAPIVLLDWDMPKISGLDLCKHVRSNYPDHPVYIIIMTANSDRHSLVQAFEAGADEYTAKPFRLEEIKARIQTGRRVLALQRRLIDKKNEFEMLIGSIGSILISLDYSLSVLHWNFAASEFFGLDAIDAMTKPLQSLPLLGTTEIFVKQLDKVKQTRRSVRGIDIQTKAANGKQRWLRVNIDPIEDDGTVTGFLIIADDVSEQRNLEQQLLNAQKLESIGQLASGIAHEINTPVQFVSDNAGFLDESFQAMMSALQLLHTLLLETPADNPCQMIEDKREELDLDFYLDETPAALEQIHEGLDKIAKIVRAMKEFSHPEAPVKQPVDLNHAIETTVIVARNEWKYVSEVVTEFDEFMPHVQCHPGEFNQVILNLIINASHAIGDVVGDSGEKGVITIKTSHDDKDAIITISDTGGGIPEGIVGRIFDPFFTTKEVGRGTGQGLAISRNVIVDKHDGSLSVSSRIGEGSTFTIRIPLFETTE